MVQELRQRIGIILARFYFRKQSYPQRDFTDAFSTARSALVIVPENSEHRAMAIPVLTQLQNKFRGNRMTVVVHDSFLDLSSSLAHCNVFPLRKEQIGFFLLPKRFAVRDLFRQSFDIVIDLNIPLVLSAAYICRGTNSALKVGFTKEHGDFFYNFQFSASAQQSPHIRYQHLLHTMAMF